jgi:hypothetical protein
VRPAAAHAGGVGWAGNPFTEGGVGAFVSARVPIGPVELLAIGLVHHGGQLFNLFGGVMLPDEGDMAWALVFRTQYSF